MTKHHRYSVGRDEDQASVGVPQRWLTLWEEAPSDQPALLDAAFTSKSMAQSSHVGSSEDEDSGRLPQG